MGVKQSRAGPILGAGRADLSLSRVLREPCIRIFFRAHGSFCPVPSFRILGAGRNDGVERVVSREWSMRPNFLGAHCLSQIACARLLAAGQCGEQIQDEHEIQASVLAACEVTAVRKPRLLLVTRIFRGVVYNEHHARRQPYRSRRSS